jgi:ubiquinone/menaquinone biosynthesis C-methylase UbiE
MKNYLYKDLFDEEEKHWWHRAKRKIVLDIIKKHLNPKMKIVDIGCGTGKNMESLKQVGEVWGIDSSLEAIKYCKKRGLHNVILGNGEKTKLSSNKFDLVTLLDVLEHADDEKMLEETYRILKPHGYILITVPALPWMWSEWDNVLHHKRRYTKHTLSNILVKNGFHITTISYMYFFLLLPAFLIRLIKSKSHKKNYGSDFSLSNGLLNSILEKVASFERYLVKRELVPIGLSLVVLAQKL